ncbi:MAG TPA: hypothetical protein VK615_10820, partial [Candidatus Binatia bacterium]|nr:hypothetical protein [Candidatus Binatia bacterium]
REYTDILAAEYDPKRYRKKNWRVKIDGIEGHAAYLTPMHRYLYDTIHIGDATKLVRKLPSYDFIFLGDIIEHLDKNTGQDLLRDCIAKARKATVITTPKFETHQPDLCGNELERHRSLWSAENFRKFKGSIIKTIDRDTLLVLIPHPAIAADARKLSSKRGTIAPSTAGRLEATRRALVEAIPLNQRFILVDEEQFRSNLPHRGAIPFLERNGQYWGPPADDQTAIRELQRLRKTGATMIVFTWPSFWWLEHYREFHRHLQKHFSRIQKDNFVKIFSLI